MQELRSLLPTVIDAALMAGREILEVYESDFAIQHKDDRSPLTLADQRAHGVIEKHLSATGFPLLSEEGRNIPFDERSQWDAFWMVDPLDGTKEFIKRNGEFTVNIALIDGTNPALGVIYVPVKDTLYFAAEGVGAYKCAALDGFDGDLDDLIARSTQLPATQKDNKPYTVVGSRSHMSEETESFIEELKKEHGEIEIASMGSSLKICLVAEGTADVYPRFAPTMEWDTAAGQAIVQCAGKELIDYKSGVAMQYNREEMLNNWFIVR